MEYYYDHLKYLLATILSVGVVLVFDFLYGEDSWSWLIIKVFLSLIIPNLIYVLFLFRHPCFRDALKLSMNVVGLKGKKV